MGADIAASAHCPDTVCFSSVWLCVAAAPSLLFIQHLVPSVSVKCVAASPSPFGSDRLTPLRGPASPDWLPNQAGFPDCLTPRFRRIWHLTVNLPNLPPVPAFLRMRFKFLVSLLPSYLAICLCDSVYVSIPCFGLQMPPSLFFADNWMFSCNTRFAKPNPMNCPQSASKSVDKFRL